MAKQYGVLRDSTQEPTGYVEAEDKQMEPAHRSFDAVFMQF